jgi:hypothetical protein
MVSLAVPTTRIGSPFLLEKGTTAIEKAASFSSRSSTCSVVDYEKAKTTG